MPRSRHYSPAIQRFLISVLYHEARSQNIPMTRLTNQLLEESLKNTPGWIDCTGNAHERRNDCPHHDGQITGP